MAGLNGEVARAGTYLGRVNCAIIKTAASKRQRHWGKGDRAPSGLAAAPVALRSLTRPVPGGKVEAVTPLGYKTACRTLPPLLAGLDEADPRRRVAVMFADAAEKLGSISGAQLEGGDTKGGISDGGVTTRIKHATRLRQLVAACYEDSPVQGRPPRHKVALPIRRQRGDRQEILAFQALWALCVEGHDLAQVLQSHGWTVHSKHTKALGAALLKVLDGMAELVGLGRAGD